MKQILAKLFDWQALLNSARAAVCGLLPFPEAEADDPPSALLADFVRSSALLATGAGWDMHFAGRYALATAADSFPMRSDTSAKEKLFPTPLLTFRKETLGFQAACPDSPGQGAAATESPHTPHASKSIGSPTGEVIMPTIDAAQIAKFKKDTLEDFDDLDEYAEELGHEPLSDKAKSIARQLVLRIFEEDPDVYIISPEDKGSVSICFSKSKKHYCTILCNPDGSVTCIVTRYSNTSHKTYASIDGLPDEYIRAALAPNPEAGSL